MTPLHADAALATRLEQTVAWDFAAHATVVQAVYPQDAPARLDLGGGGAFYFGAGSPLNQAVGLGMNEEPPAGAIAAVGAFFEERDATPVALTCPLAHPSLFAQLAREGWLAVDFENVLALDLDMKQASAGDEDPILDPDRIRVEFADDDAGRELWVRLSLEGFANGAAASPAEEHLARVMAARSDVVLVTASVDGVPAGSAALGMRERDAWLLADSTVPNMRGQGVQQALQRARLDMARQAGCSLAVTESKPGSVSQRNMERLGFRVLYTRVEFSAPLRSATGGPNA